MSIRKVITTCGGITALARALKHRHPSTVQGWWERQVIPAWQQRSVLQIAQMSDPNITAFDLLPVGIDPEESASCGAHDDVVSHSTPPLHAARLSGTT